MKARAYSARLRRCTVVVIGALLVSIAPPASAKPKPKGPNPEAVAAFEDGQAEFSQANYEAALAAFRRAAEIQPAPALWYNIGLCHLRLGEFEAAIEALETYLREADPPDRADVEHMLEQAREDLEASRRPNTEENDGLASDDSALTVESDPAPSGEGEERKSHRGLVIAGASALGLGLAVGLGGTLGFGLAVHRRNDAIRRFNASEGTDGTLEETVVLQDEARRFETAEFVMLGVGLALSVGGAVALGVGLHRKSRGARTETMARQRVQWGMGATAHGFHGAARLTF